MKQFIVAALFAVASAEDTPPNACGAAYKFEFFTDKACTKAQAESDDTKAAAKKWKDAAEASEGKCVAESKSKLTCTAAGLTTQKFKDDKCAEADGDATTDYAWGACKEVTADKLYVKVSGGKTIMAGAAALLALAASQF